MNKYNRISKFREYLSRWKKLDDPSLETARLVLEDYDRMRLQLSVLIGEIKCRKRVSAKVIVDQLDNILWEDHNE